jgi:hypothetical protein
LFKKHVLYLLIMVVAVLLCIILVPGFVIAAEPQFRVETTASQVKINDVFGVNVWFNTGSISINGVEFTLKYDPTVVQRTYFSAGKAYEKGSGFNQSEDVNIFKDNLLKGEISYAVAGKQPRNGNLELLRLKFKAIKAGVTSFDASNNKVVLSVYGKLQETSPYSAADSIVTVLSALGIGGTTGGGSIPSGGGVIVITPVAGLIVNPFKDISLNHWAVNDIVYLWSLKIITGFSDQTFRPDMVVTRGEMAVLLTRALKLETSNTQRPGRFMDVSGMHWALKEIEAVAKIGLMVGFNKKFMSEKPISREEMAVIIVKAINLSKGQETSRTINRDSLKRFKDIEEIPEWARDSVAEAVDLGIIRGVADDQFGAGRKTTRAQTAVLINKLLKLREAK